MQVSFSKINFCGKPANYSVIDKYLSRSAQPQKEDIQWLKEQGITDIFSFRTLAPDINFNEEIEVTKAGIKYHNIPSITKEPNEKNIDIFLKEVEEVKRLGGKAHIHCKAGADRTSMYAFIYKTKNGIGTFSKNIAEWFSHGYHFKIYPDLIKWTVTFAKKYEK